MLQHLCPARNAPQPPPLPLQNLDATCWVSLKPWDCGSHACLEGGQILKHSNIQSLVRTGIHFLCWQYGCHTIKRSYRC